MQESLERPECDEFESSPVCARQCSEDEPSVCARQCSEGVWLVAAAQQDDIAMSTDEDGQEGVCAKMEESIVSEEQYCPIETKRLGEIGLP